jgi:serine/threonine-protein kinase
LPDSNSRKAGDPAARDPLVGQVVSDRYRIEERLGAGGMGAVYRATHVHMRKSMALKVLHHEMAWKPEAVARFEREAVAAARVEHPNVAAAKDFGRIDDRSYYLALEFVEGRSLRQVLHEQKPFDAKRALRIIRQVAEALSAAHAQEIVHRDLKPENIMLQNDSTPDEFVKVLDFGLAKLEVEDEPESSVDAPTELTKSGSVFGTPTYMSPEQASGKPVDQRSDLYSLGIVLYEMLCGEAPFKGEAIVVVLTKHLHEAPPPLPPWIDPRLSALVLRLLEKHPDARPQSADALIEAIDALDLNDQGTATLARSGGSQLRRTSQRVWMTLRASAHEARRRALPLWHALQAKVPVLGVLERRIDIAGHGIPVGVLGLCGSFVFAVILLLLLLPTTDATDTSELAEDVVLTEEGVVAPPAGSVVELDEGDETRLQDILAMPVYKRKLQQWLDLGALYAKSGRLSESTSAYRNAVQLDKSQRENPVLLQTVRTAAERRDSYQVAINLATTQLEERGMDLLYDLWVHTKDDRKKRLMAELAYKKLEILRLSKASKPLRVRLELEFADPEDCESIKKTLEDAIRYADQRSVEALTKLEKTDGCGASQTKDCYACLRDNDDIDVAIEAARELKAPRFDGSRFIPGQ